MTDASLGNALGQERKRRDVCVRTGGQHGLIVVAPMIIPRASSRQWGAKRPVSAGTNTTCWWVHGL